jgi:Carboxypeptidase regulatory-like domain/TonB dependent receptor
MTRSLRFRIILLSLFLLCLTRLGYAQGDTARLQGTITDAQGAAVEGANLTVTNTGTARTVSVTTNDLGYYTMSALPAGHYRVEVTKQGFKTVSRELDLQVAQIGVADFQLTVGEVTQSVTVEAGSPVIDPADSALGEVIEGRQVTELPLNGRNFTQLATLVPGVTRGVPTGSSTGANNNAETFRYGQAGGASLVVNGLRPQANNFILDGVDNNEALVNTIVFFPPADAIDEFRVQTNLAPAQYGRAGGAIVVTSLKSGTNEWHGSAFWFNRNTNLNARDFFDNTATPKFNRNQFGGTVGGPIWKNKLFIFGDYQGLRLRQPAVSDGVGTVPTDLMRGKGTATAGEGDFSELLAGAGPAGNPTGLSSAITVFDPTTGLQFMGTGAQPNVIPSNRINKAGLAYLNAFPEPNCTRAQDSRCGTVINNFRGSENKIEIWNDFDIRTDYIINTTNSIFGRFSRGRADQTQQTFLPNLPSCNGFGCGTNFNHPYGASIGWTDTINPSLVSEARLGFVRTKYGFENPFNGVDICTQLGIANCNTPLLGGIALIGGFNTQIQYTGDFGPYIVPQTGYTYSETLSWTKGKHALKFGGTVIRRQLNLFRPLTGKGFFFLSGNGNAGHTNTNYEVSDLLAGFTDNYQHGTTTGMVGTRTWENGLFAQDDWRITPRLTLNLGLRYDVLTWPVEVENRQANFDLATGHILLAGKNGASRSFIPNDYNNFGPRIGFAYQLTRDGKTVVRGGYGIFYFLERGGVSNQLAQNAPFAGQNSFSYSQGARITFTGSLACQPTCTPAQLISTNASGPLPSGDFTTLDLNNPSNVSMVAVLPSNTTPSVSQWNLQVQRQLDNNSFASLAYVADRGKNLVRNFNANQQLFGIDNALPTSRLFANLGSINVQDTHGNSTYNSLQAQYERRFAHGWQFLGGFTWSKTLDDSCGDLDVCNPQLYTNYRLEHGRADIDQNYRLTLSSLYELPIGRGKRWGSNWSTPVNWIAGGWQINGIYTLQSGLPFSVSANGTPSNARADQVGKPAINTGFVPGADQSRPANTYVSPAAFALPAATLYADGNIVFGAPGTAGRNILRGPGSSNLDFAIFKNLSVTERIKVELRGQAYNLTNTPHFGNPNGNLGSWNTQNCNATPSNQPCVLVNGVSKQLVPNPNQQFGQVSSTVPFSYRQVELGLRVTF